MGYDLVYLMNGAIGIGDYVQVKSKYLTGFFPGLLPGNRRGQHGRAWQCKARVLEVTDEQSVWGSSWSR